MYWDETNSTEEKDKVERPKQSEEDKVKEGIPRTSKKGTSKARLMKKSTQNGVGYVMGADPYTKGQSHTAILFQNLSTGTWCRPKKIFGFTVLIAV